MRAFALLQPTSSGGLSVSRFGTLVLAGAATVLLITSGSASAATRSCGKAQGLANGISVTKVTTNSGTCVTARTVAKKVRAHARRAVGLHVPGAPVRSVAHNRAGQVHPSRPHDHLQSRLDQRHATAGNAGPADRRRGFGRDGRLTADSREKDGPRRAGHRVTGTGFTTSHNELRTAAAKGVRVTRSPVHARRRLLGCGRPRSSSA